MVAPCTLTPALPIQVWGWSTYSPQEGFDRTSPYAVRPIGFLLLLHCGEVWLPPSIEYTSRVSAFRNPISPLPPPSSVSARLAFRITPSPSFLACAHPHYGTRQICRAAPSRRRFGFSCVQSNPEKPFFFFFCTPPKPAPVAPPIIPLHPPRPIATGFFGSFQRSSNVSASRFDFLMVHEDKQLDPNRVETARPQPWSGIAE